MQGTGRGPLAGLRIVEMDAIGPVPLLGLLLAGNGAEVIRIGRAASDWTEATTAADILHRGRDTVVLDLKDDTQRLGALDLIAGADALIEGFRPGTMERLGLGPEVALGRNPALVYGRMTGWGQVGPRAAEAGHDINYLSMTGLLSMIGPADRPVAPLNLVADYGGGAMMLAFGLMAALLQAKTTGKGQVVDAAMVDGANFLASLFHGFRQTDLWSPGREANLLDGGRPFYRCYPCADGRFVAVGAIEPKFYGAMMRGLGLDPADWPQDDASSWDGAVQAIGARFATAPRDHWTRIFAGTDACVTPVLDLAEAPADPHMQARRAFQAAGARTAPSVPPSDPQARADLPPPRLVSLQDALARWRR